jgi:hypothetical protein
MKVSIFVFIVAVLNAGSVGAHESGASSATSEGVSITDEADQIFERAVDERISRLGLFDRSEDGSGRYGVSLDLENEDSDWNFEVTITVEF